MGLVLIVVALLALLGHGYLWVGIVNRLHGSAGSRGFVARTTRFCIFCFLLLPVLVVWRREFLVVGSFSAVTFQAAALNTYVYGCAFWGSAKLLLLAIGDKLRDPPDVLLAWRQESSAAAAGLGLETFHGSYARLLSRVPGNQSLQLKVDFRRLKILRLQGQHEGLRLAHISDLHMTGHMGLPWYEAVVQQVNLLKADVVALTGDIVEHEACWPWLTDCLAQLRAEYGVYFVLGNHDVYIDSKTTRRLLVEAGFQCLSASLIETQWRGAPVLLVGNERPWLPEVASFDAAPRRREDQLPLRIALLHSPDQFGWAAEHDVDLALAGHTHGGQFRLPLLGPVACPSRHGTRYACGVFRRENTVLHVTRGIASKMPLRWNCPPEIALLELARA